MARIPTIVSVVGGENLDVFPHMLDHYRSLGIRQFLIQALGNTCEDAALSRLAKTAAAFGVGVSSVSVGPWAADLNQTLYALPRNSRPSDWFVLADHDEFHAYPDNLAEIFEYCDAKGYDYIEGALVDRIAADGTFSSISLEESIWSKYPLGGLLSANILGAVINKVVAAKGHVKLSIGQHAALSGRGCPPSAIYVPVYHFKWTHGLVERLNQRIHDRESISRRGRYVRECRAFLDYFNRLNKIDVSDDRLYVAPCDPSYRLWHKVVEWRLAAAHFSLRLNTKYNLSDI